ncbi:MAG TPA: hypothetical protein VGC21_02795 [Telluria sp.]|jgi:hypothetical protein
MMDLLLEQTCDRSKIQYFLSLVFESSVARIRVFSSEEFNALNEELSDSSIDCACVFSSVSGDAAQLLQLYRYRVDQVQAVTRIAAIATQNGIRCYLPTDSLDVWICVGHGDGPKSVKQIECDEDDCYLFV